MKPSFGTLSNRQGKKSKKHEWKSIPIGFGDEFGFTGGGIQVEKPPNRTVTGGIN
ncbi:hypothetical protein [Leptospira levettii]|uniref:hypothetical protein n=1 Tax=Leptospira levettii TaxID=2023178 RepID=UPI0014382BB6|nr:hypothetical protein [Leptospira levettii]